MLWSKFEQFFHPSWHSKIKKFIESQECDEIYRFLKSESKSGKTIAPESKNVFRAFKETSLDDLKVVICLMDPYNKLINNKPIADGLAMSCSITDKLQPSLNCFYEGLLNEFDSLRVKNYYKNPDLTYLANQGVLMLNTALTVEANKAGSHLEIWKPFTIFLFKEVFSNKGIPIVFLGKDAQLYKKHLGIFDNIYELSHPVSASYNNSIWKTNGTFEQISQTLKIINNEEIEWLKIIN